MARTKLMTRTIKTKILGTAEQLENKSSVWIYQKAQELGFTEAEIERLRATYERKAATRKNSNLINIDHQEEIVPNSKSFANDDLQSKCQFNTVIRQHRKGKS